MSYLLAFTVILLICVHGQCPSGSSATCSTEVNTVCCMDSTTSAIKVNKYDNECFAHCNGATVCGICCDVLSGCNDSDKECIMDSSFGAYGYCQTVTPDTTSAASTTSSISATSDSCSDGCRSDSDCTTNLFGIHQKCNKSGSGDCGECVDETTSTTSTTTDPCHGGCMEDSDCMGLGLLPQKCEKPATTTGCGICVYTTMETTSVSATTTKTTDPCPTGCTSDSDCQTSVLGTTRICYFATSSTHCGVCLDITTTTTTTTRNDAMTTDAAECDIHIGLNPAGTGCALYTCDNTVSSIVNGGILEKDWSDHYEAYFQDACPLLLYCDYDNYIFPNSCKCPICKGYCDETTACPDGYYCKYYTSGTLSTCWDPITNTHATHCYGECINEPRTTSESHGDDDMTTSSIKMTEHNEDETTEAHDPYCYEDSDCEDDEHCSIISTNVFCDGSTHKCPGVCIQDDTPTKPVTTRIMDVTDETTVGCIPLNVCHCLTLEYEPRCCDNVQYNSKCLAECHCAENCILGECDDDSNVMTTSEMEMEGSDATDGGDSMDDTETTQVDDVECYTDNNCKTGYCMISDDGCNTVVGSSSSYHCKGKCVDYCLTDDDCKEYGDYTCDKSVTGCTSSTISGHYNDCHGKCVSDVDDVTTTGVVVKDPNVGFQYGAMIAVSFGLIACLWI